MVAGFDANYYKGLVARLSKSTQLETAYDSMAGSNGILSKQELNFYKNRDANLTAAPPAGGALGNQRTLFRQDSGFGATANLVFDRADKNGDSRLTKAELDSYQASLRTLMAREVAKLPLSNGPQLPRPSTPPVAGTPQPAPAPPQAAQPTPAQG